jgi:ribosomal-protein-alanine N-acetyltransferase
MSELLPARTTDLGWLGPAAVQSRIVDRAAELAGILRAEPWRLWVTQRGEAAIIDRWREHSSDCAVLGLWCAPRRVPVLIAELEQAAASLGFRRLIGPLVPEEAVRPYLNAGMTVAERIVVMRLDARGIARLLLKTTPPDSVTVRAGTIDDVPRIVGIDAASFDEFWRYDERTLRRLLVSGRMLVAEEGSEPIGYTLATVHGSESSLGRLAVLPSYRGRGIGHALARAAVGLVSGEGAKAMVLSSQEDNVSAQALYRSLGFAIVPGRLMVCVSGPL